MSDWESVYRHVKDCYPELFERGVQIGHLGLENFGGTDELKRAAKIETAVIYLIKDIMEPL